MTYKSSFCFDLVKSFCQEAACKAHSCCPKTSNFNFKRYKKENVV